MSLHSSRAINRILQDSEMFPVPYVKACFSALLSVIVAASCTWILPVSMLQQSYHIVADGCYLLES